MSKDNQEKKLAPNGMEELNTRDDALFDELGKSKKKKKRRVLRIVVSILVILALVLTGTVMTLRRRVREQFGMDNAQVLSHQVTSGSISTVVSGSGTLANVDTETVSVPDGVTVLEILVSAGDAVSEGKLLATVDQASVSTAMATLQKTIEDLDDQISDAEDDKVSTYVKAGVSGRLKGIYAEKDTAVADCMVAHGALAVISLDGYMAMDLETDILTIGQSVTLVREDGEELEATVKSAANGRATVLVTDNGTVLGEKLTVKTGDGTIAGSGELYVHNPLAVTGYAGTVSQILAKENQKVSSHTTLFALKDTSSSANYDSLLRSRQEAEETLLDLLRIRRSGGIPAPISGSVYTITEGQADLMVLSPDAQVSVTVTVDEGDILSLELGQSAQVTVNSVSEDSFAGSVTEIDRTASSGAFTAVVTLPKEEGMLPGMTASVDVRIEGVENALIIPIEALHKTSNTAYVYTSYDSQSQQYGGKVNVTVGLSNSNYVQILSGLKEGDTVFYTKTMTLADLFGSMGFGGMENHGGNRGQNGERPNMGDMPPMGNQPGNGK